MSRRGIALALLAVAGLAVLAAPTASAQCAMCRTALANSPEGRSMGAQFNAAILVMLFAPYVVAATLAGVLFRRQLGARLARLSQGSWAERLWGRWRPGGSGGRGARVVSGPAVPPIGREATPQRGVATDSSDGWRR